MTLGLAAMIAFPAQAPAGSAMPGTLVDYESGGKYYDSTIGNYTVAVTSYNAQNSGISANNIMVTPVTTGLQFSLPNSDFEGTMDGLNLAISSTITDSGGRASITIASMAMTNVTVSGTRVAKISDTTPGLSTSLGAGTNMKQDQIYFSNPMTSVTFNDQLSVQIGAGAGVAVINSYTDLINTPEPSTFVLALIGAVGVATLAGYDRRRRTPR